LRLAIKARKKWRKSVGEGENETMPENQKDEKKNASHRGGGEKQKKLNKRKEKDKMARLTGSPEVSIAKKAPSGNGTGRRKKRGGKRL